MSDHLERDLNDLLESRAASASVPDAIVPVLARARRRRLLNGLVALALVVAVAAGGTVAARAVLTDDDPTILPAGDSESRRDQVAEPRSGFHNSICSSIGSGFDAQPGEIVGHGLNVGTGHVLVDVSTTVDPDALADGLPKGWIRWTLTVEGGPVKVKAESTGSSWEVWLEDGDRRRPADYELTLSPSDGGSTWHLVVSDPAITSHLKTVTSTVIDSAGEHRTEKSCT